MKYKRGILLLAGEKKDIEQTSSHTQKLAACRGMSNVISEINVISSHKEGEGKNEAVLRLTILTSTCLSVSNTTRQPAGAVQHLHERDGT